VRPAKLVSGVVSLVSRRPIVVILVVAILVRVVTMAVLQSWRFPDQWSFGYEIGYLGRSLVQGHGFSFWGIPTAKYPPVYPLLVAATFATLGIDSTPSAVALLLFQSVCAAVAAVCLTTVGSRFFGRRVGIIAGLVWAVYPSSIVTSVVRVWYSEFSIMLFFLLLVIADPSKRDRLALRAACLGALSGLLAITEPTMLVVAGLVFLWVMRKRKLTREWLRPALAWAIAGAVVVSPWAIRNSVVLGTPSIVKTNLGLELFFGNNPFSTGGGIDREREQALAALDEGEHTYYRDQPEDDYFNYLGRKALGWIRQHPKEFVRLSAKRVWFFWGEFPSSGPEMWSRYSRVLLVWYAPTALLAILGLWWSVRRRLDFAPVWLFLSVYPIPFYVTHVQLYRYRYPVEPFLVLLAAIPVATWCVHLAKRLTSTLHPGGPPVPGKTDEEGVEGDQGGPSMPRTRCEPNGQAEFRHQEISREGVQNGEA